MASAPHASTIVLCQSDLSFGENGEGDRFVRKNTMGDRTTRHTSVRDLIVSIYPLSFAIDPAKTSETSPDVVVKPDNQAHAQPSLYDS